MQDRPAEILSALDQCCSQFTFPMLDNGYVYLAATRLSLFRSASDWAMVIEVFGFSPRSEFPAIHLYTFASRLHERNRPEDYVNAKAYENYLANNPHNESRYVYPVTEGDWQDPDNCEFISETATQVVVREQSIPIPQVDDYIRHGIELEDSPKAQVFELCRFLAETSRELILATPSERRMSVLPEMELLLTLDEWNHPNVVDDEELPSRSETFQQLAMVLSTGNTEHYHPTQTPNTHWKNWPEGGRL